MADVNEISDFTFYIGFTKKLLLNLSDPRDRSIAASWLKKLREINEKNDMDTVHLEYLKLLLIAMHGNKFSTFFEKLPPEGNLEPIDISEILSAIKPAAKSEISYPLVYTSVSGDLCDFVAIQEIPNYGLQGYYAISAEPLSNWIHMKRSTNDFPEKLPKENKDGDRNIQFEKRMSPTTPSKEPIRNSEMVNAKESTHQSKTSIEIHNDDSSVRRRKRAGIETRPCWGTNRYIERLIDESPYFTSDLGLTQADAFLHNLKDRKMEKIEENTIENHLCFLSSKRRQVERMMDLPRCATDPGEEEIKPNTSKRTNFSCRPKKQKEINIDCIDLCVLGDDEDEDDFYYPPENEYEIMRNRNIKSKGRIQNKISSYKSSYFPNNRPQQKLVRNSAAERIVEKIYPLRQNERGCSIDDKVEDINLSSEFLLKTKNRSRKSVSTEQQVPEKTIILDSSDKTRVNVSLPSQPTKLNSEHQSMGSYGPVSGFTTDAGISNEQYEDFEIRSPNFVTLQSDISDPINRNRSSTRSQDIVYLRTDDNKLYKTYVEIYRI